KRQIEGIAEPHKARDLVGAVDVQHTCGRNGLIGDKANRASANTSKADHRVRGKVLLNLQEVLVVDQACDHLLDVVSLLRIVGNDRVQHQIVGQVNVERFVWRFLDVVGRQKAQEPPADLGCMLVVLGDE